MEILIIFFFLEGAQVAGLWTCLVKKLQGKAVRLYLMVVHMYVC